MHDYWLEFSAVALAHLLAVASPGPDFAIVLRQSFAYGRRIALWTSVGVGTAISVHVTYSLLGLGWLIRRSPTWFNGVKYAGAAYLLWIGVRSLLTRPRMSTSGTGESTAPNDLAAPSPLNAFATGFLTNALNPKV